MNLKDYFSYLFNISKLKKIKLLVSDIDGVMTDGRLIFDDNGVESKFFHTQDGMGVVMALKSNIKVAVISGSNSNAIKVRFDKFRKHGFEDLILGEENKMPSILTLMDKYGSGRRRAAALYLTPRHVYVTVFERKSGAWLHSDVMKWSAPADILYYMSVLDQNFGLHKSKLYVRGNGASEVCHLLQKYFRKTRCE